MPEPPPTPVLTSIPSGYAPPKVHAHLWSASIISATSPKSSRTVVVSLPNSDELQWAGDSRCRQPGAVRLVATTDTPNGFNARRAALFSAGSISCNANTGNLTLVLLFDPFYVAPAGAAGEVVEVMLSPSQVFAQRFTVLPYDASSVSFVIWRSTVFDGSVSRSLLLASYAAAGATTLIGGLLGHASLTTVVPRANFLGSVAVCDFDRTFEVDYLQYWLRIPVGTTPYRHFLGAALFNLITVLAVGVSYLALAVWRGRVVALASVEASFRVAASAAAKAAAAARANPAKFGSIGESVKKRLSARKEKEARRADKANGAPGSSETPATTTAADTAPPVVVEAPVSAHVASPAPPPPADPVLEASLSGILWRTSVPRRQIFLFVLFSQVAARTTLVVAWHSDDTGDRVFAGILIGPWLLLAIGALYAVLFVFPVFWDPEKGVIKTSQDAFLEGPGKWVLVAPPPPAPASKAAAKHGAPLDAAATRSAETPRNETDASVASAAASVVAVAPTTAPAPKRPATGFHVPETFQRKLFPLYGRYRGGRHWFFAVELLVSIACGVMESVRTTKGCVPVAISALAVGAVYFVVLLIFRPYAAPIDTYFFAFNAFAMTLVPVFQLVYLSSDGREGWAETVASILIVVWLWATVLRCWPLLREAYLGLRTALAGNTGLPAVVHDLRMLEPWIPTYVEERPLPPLVVCEGGYDIRFGPASLLWERPQRVDNPPLRDQELVEVPSVARASEARPPRRAPMSSEAGAAAMSLL